MSLQQFPYPCSIDDRFILAISRTFPLFMTLSWIYSSAMIIKSIVYEKEKRLKETMRVMGLGNGVHWVSWFVDSFVVMIFSAGLLSLLLKVSTFLSFLLFFRQIADFLFTELISGKMHFSVKTSQLRIDLTEVFDLSTDLN